jgi:hypothetical protein
MLSAMVVLRSVPMTFLQWVFLACFLYSSMVLKSPAPSCDPYDLVALKEFAGNFTNGSIITAWSGESNCCKWDGVVCENGKDNGSVAGRMQRIMVLNT